MPAASMRRVLVWGGKGKGEEEKGRGEGAQIHIEAAVEFAPRPCCRLLLAVRAHAHFDHAFRAANKRRRGGKKKEERGGKKS